MSRWTMPGSITLLPRGVVGRRLTRLRARVRHARLDAALAEGADPWSAGPLMARAAHLCSLSHRQQLITGLVSIVELAEHRRPGSPYLVVRDRAVLEHRESLLALAAAGEVATEDVRRAAFLLPFLLVGFLVSGPLRRHVDGSRLRVAVLVVSASSAVLLLVRTLVFG